MGSYSYEAIDSAGKIVKGTVEAENEEGVKAELKRQSITPVSIKQQGALNKDLNIDIGGKPSTRDLSVFCRQFVAMFRAGVSMIDALKMLTEAKSKDEKALARRMAEDTQKEIEKIFEAQD